MGEGGVDLEHDDEELQEVDVHLHRFLTDELLPAMVNQIRKAAGQLLVKELRQIVVVERFFNDNLHENMTNTHRHDYCQFEMMA